MSVFVQIPAYRDFELNKTILSAVNNASKLNKISFGVHNCLLFDGEIELIDDLPEWATVRSVTSIAPENIGLQRARYIANELYDGEDYYFQVDSHMRFAKDWDVNLIDGVTQYQNMGLRKPLITQYPPSYVYEDDGTEEHWWDDPFVQKGIWFGENQQQFKDVLIPTQTPKIISSHCGFTKSASGGMIFTIGEFSTIKPNPKIAFRGEEILIAARAFTHGFDLVMPFANSVCHLYRSRQPFAKVRRHEPWVDFPDIWTELEWESTAEYERIFCYRTIGEGALGNERTLEDFEEFSGINFRTRQINPCLSSLG